MQKSLTIARLVGPVLSAIGALGGFLTFKAYVP